MFNSQLRKLVIELLVPGVQDEDLEAERRGANDKVCQREPAGDEHAA